MNNRAQHSVATFDEPGAPAYRRLAIQETDFALCRHAAPA